MVAFASAAVKLQTAAGSEWLSQELEHGPYNDRSGNYLSQFNVGPPRTQTLTDPDGITMSTTALSVISRKCSMSSAQSCTQWTLLLSMRRCFFPQERTLSPVVLSLQADALSRRRSSRRRALLVGPLGWARSVLEWPREPARSTSSRTILFLQSRAGDAVISDESYGDGKRIGTARSVSFRMWTTVILFANAAGAAIFVALAGVALNLPFRRLWVPYTALCSCGLLLAPSLYWARLSRERPKSCAIRFAIAIFLYIQAVMVALGSSTIRLGILSQSEVVYDYAPFMEAFSVIVSIPIYVTARLMFKAPQSGSV